MPEYVDGFVLVIPKKKMGQSFKKMAYGGFETFVLKK